jgi:hypothetical protein
MSQPSTPSVPLRIHKPVIHIEELGEQGRLPDGGLINAGGVEGPNFTVGGKAIILADGTASDGSGPVIVVGSSVIGFEWIQSVPSEVWTIPHGKNSKKIQVTIWDEVDEQVYSDTVKIVDLNTVLITFNTPISGRAILMIF